MTKFLSQWYPFSVYRVEGDSMLPTLHPNQRVLVNRWSKGRPGDLIVFKKNAKTLIKRIERIEAGQRFVQGDNSDQSTDSRAFGGVEYAQIVGTVIF